MGVIDLNQSKERVGMLTKIDDGLLIGFKNHCEFGSACAHIIF